MAGSLTFGFSVTPSGTGEPESSPSHAEIYTLELTNSLKAADQTTSVPASTAVASPTRLWTASNHGVSATSPSVDVMLAIADPAKTATDGSTVKIRGVYTRSGSTTTVNGAFAHVTRNHPPTQMPGTAEDSTGTMYLTAIEAANANSEAITVRTIGWK